MVPDPKFKFDEDEDPAPSFHSDADPASQNDAGPDPASQIIRIRSLNTAVECCFPLHEMHC